MTEPVVCLLRLPDVGLGLLLGFLDLVIRSSLYGLEVMISDLEVLVLAFDIAAFEMGDNSAGVTIFRHGFDSSVCWSVFGITAS